MTKQRETVSSRIREWMLTQSSPVTTRQVADGAGVDYKVALATMGNMSRGGYVVKVSGPDRTYPGAEPATYAIGRAPRPWRFLDAEASEAARKARDAAYGSARNAAKRAARAEAVAARGAERARKKEAARAKVEARKAERMRLAKEKAAAQMRRLSAQEKREIAQAEKVGHQLRALAGRAESMSHEKPAKATAKPESIAEFLARGGRIQRVECGQMAQGLKRIRLEPMRYGRKAA